MGFLLSIIYLLFALAMAYPVLAVLVAAHPVFLSVLSYEFAKMKGSRPTWILVAFVAPVVLLAITMLILGNPIGILCILYALILLLIWMRGSRQGIRYKMKHSPAGTCLTCGYDLTATPDDKVCPECGRVQSRK